MTDRMTPTIYSSASTMLKALTTRVSRTARIENDFRVGFGLFNYRFPNEKLVF
jgi:hypothetical protein